MVHWIRKFAGSDDFDAVGGDHLRFVWFCSLWRCCGAAGKEGKRQQKNHRCERGESFRGHDYSIKIHGFQVPMPQRARRQKHITTNGTLLATSSDKLKPR